MSSKQNNKVKCQKEKKSVVNIIFLGHIGITQAAPWYLPYSNASEDIEATKRALDFTWGWFANPIFHPNGDYPERFKARLAQRSSEEGRITSRLPEFTQEEILKLKG